MANRKGCKKPEKLTKTLEHGYSYAYETTQRERESYPINTRRTGFRCFSKIFVSLYVGGTLEESSLSIGRVKCRLDVCLKQALEFSTQLTAEQY